MLRQNRPRDAEEAFKKSIQLKPEYALPYYELGKLLASHNQPRSAAEQLERAIQREPNLVQAYYQLARVYRQLGETGRASEALAKFNSRKTEEASEERQLAADIATEVQ